MSTQHETEDRSSRDNGDERDDMPERVGGANAFDNLDSLRLSQNFRDEIGVVKARVRVPVRKPNRQEFVRVRDEENYRMETAILELKEERETFLLTPEVRDALPGEWYPVRLVTAMNRLGIVFLWPLKLAGTYGQSNPWYDTAMEAANLAAEKWVKIESDMALGGYQTSVAIANLSEPVWPPYDFQQLLNVAFRDRLIQSTDHPIIKRLLGQE